MTFVLDTGIVGRLCHPHVAQHQRLTEWLAEVLSQRPRGARLILPEIADYELRRKLLHLTKKNPRAERSLRRLDESTTILMLLGPEPGSAEQIGLRPDARALAARIRGDLEREPFSEATLRLIEDLIRFLRKDLVAVRLYEGGYRRDGWNARSCA